VLADLGDLQRHETFVNCSDILVAGQVTKGGAIALGNFGDVAQGPDVIPFPHAHGTPSLFQADLHAELGKGLDENLGRCEGTEVDDRAGPIENGGLQLCGLLIVHCSTPSMIQSGLVAGSVTCSLTVGWPRLRNSAAWVKLPVRATA